VYEVEVLHVYENRLPELTDEFAQSVGAYTDLADFRARTREVVEMQYRRVSEQKFEWTLIDGFVRQSPFEVPNGMVERVIESEIEKVRESHPGEKLDEEALRNRMRPDAVRSVQTYLIAQAVQESQGLEVSREEISERLEVLAQAHGGSARELRRALIKEGRLDDVKSDILQHKAYAWMESVAVIREEIVPRNAPQSRIITP
jgi:trigger factor